MILISHRGNINGPNPEMENNPEYIQKALDLGYDVEVDVWGTKYGAWYLGHDGPEYLIDAKFLRQKGLWCHAKRNKVILSYDGRPKHTLFCTRYRLCCTNIRRLFLDKLVLSNDQEKYLCYATIGKRCTELCGRSLFRLY